MQSMQKEMLGILGGMGPVSSAEFVRTIYDYDMGEREQESPAVVLYSDPSFPDRTEAFLAGEDGVILAMLTDALNRLRKLGASKVVICCMTIHYLLPRLKPEQRRQVISLLDVIFSNLGQPDGRHLLICSTGTRKLRLFEGHPQWGRWKSSFIMPTDADQERIHRDLIYPIKRNPDFARLFPLIEELLIKYETDSFIVGCSEVHLLAKRFLSDERYKSRYSCIDPFMIVATRQREENR